MFKELSALLAGHKKATITITPKGDQITVGFFTETKNVDINAGLKVTAITGTPEDLDECFIAEISKVQEVVAGVLSNADQVAEEAKKVSVDTKKKPEPKKSSSKSEPKAKKLASGDDKTDKEVDEDLGEKSDEPKEGVMQPLFG